MSFWDIFKKKENKKKLRKTKNTDKLSSKTDISDDTEIIIMKENELDELIYEWESSEEIINSLLKETDNQTKDNIKFIEYLINLIDKEKLDIPMLPDIIIKIMKLSENPDTNISEYTKVVKSDQALALKIIKLANSPLYKGIRDVNDLNLAVSRIGIEELKNIVLMMSLQSKIFSNKNFKDLIEDIWKTSLLTSIIASNLANYYSLDSSKIYTIALVHDIGEVIVLDSVKGYETFYKRKYKPDNHFIKRIAKSFHQEISAFTLAHWNFSKEQISIVRTHHTPPEKTTNEYNKVLFISYQTAVILLKFKFNQENINNFPYKFIIKFSELPLKEDAFYLLLKKSLKKFKEFSNLN